MKVSIITPSFNQGEFIERTIQSVLSQEVEYEYVVMDGGSTDHTIDILKRYQSHLFWQSESDKGQSHAINKGLSITHHEIIGWLNSDDIYYPSALKKVCDFFYRHADVDVIYGDAYLIDREDQKKGFYPTEPWSLTRLKSHCFISQPATFFRRRVINEYGLLAESLQFCMDYEYWLRLALRGVNFVYLPEVLAGARLYQEAKSFRCSLEASVEMLDLIKKKLGYIPPEHLVSFSAAKVKSAGLFYPRPEFIMAVWLNLWRSTGVYYHGFYRLFMWVAAQHAMLKEFLRRNLSNFKKKFKYSM